MVNFLLPVLITDESLEQCLKDWVNTQDKASFIHHIIAIHMYKHYPIGRLAIANFIIDQKHKNKSRSFKSVIHHKLIKNKYDQISLCPATGAALYTKFSFFD